MRILLLARHYPPAVSGGARRPFLLARGLRRLGFEVFVVAPSLPEGEFGFAVPHPNRDPTGATPLGPPTLRDHAREWLLWPDPDIRWVRRAAAQAAAKAPWTPDWILATSPPESILAGGLRLKKRFGARLLADMRDHWLDPPLRTSRRLALRRSGERAIARRWLAKADLVTCVDEHVAAEMAALGARAPRVLRHFSPLKEDRAAVRLPEGDINLVHSGSLALSDPDRNIGWLLDPFERAVEVNPRLALHFVGRLSEVEKARIARSPAAARIQVHGVRSFAESLGFQHAADALALVGSPTAHVPPSKIVEYLETGAPILVAGEGAWRSDPRLAGALPVSALASLAKGAVRTGAARIPTAAEAAETLASWLRDGHRLENS